MTALDLPRFTDEQLRNVRCDSIRRVAELVTRQRITETDGHARVTRLAHWTLDTENINAAWEQLIEAERRIAHIRSGPADRDRDDRELQADWDAIHAVKRLAGPRPSTTGGHR
jgi:hypothetical protein